MKSRTLVAALLCAALYSGSAAAQLALPQPSPKASVMQAVGVTDVTVEYSSPAVKGRKVFGELVPLGKLWRTGANAATKITFSRDAKIDGKAVPAGTYSLFSIPTADSWTLILNKNANQGGTASYDEKLDLLRVNVKPEKAPKRERMTFLFNDTTDTATKLTMEWDELRLTLPIEVDTGAYTVASISSYIDGSWQPLANAARYWSEERKEHDKALPLVDASIAVKSTWYNNWIKAQILDRKGDRKAALAHAQKAHDMGSKDANFFFKEPIEKALADWKK